MRLKVKQTKKPEPALLLAGSRQWKTLRQFPDYEISNDGRLRRLTPGSNMKTGAQLRVTMSVKGYPKYGLTKPDGTRTHQNAHVLVAAEFLPEKPSPDAMVLHDDDDRLNCVWTNLKWGDGRDNVADAKRNGKWETGADHSSARKPWLRPRGTDHGKAKLNEAQVSAILLDTRIATEIARSYGVNSALIYRIRKGQIWKHITNPEYAAMLAEHNHG
jgi:hypothetical protein